MNLFRETLQHKFCFWFFFIVYAFFQVNTCLYALELESLLIKVSPDPPTNSNASVIVDQISVNSHSTSTYSYTPSWGTVDVLHVTNTGTGQVDFMVMSAVHIKKIIITNNSSGTVKFRAGGNFPYPDVTYCNLVDSSNASVFESTVSQTTTDCSTNSQCYASNATLADVNVSAASQLIWYDASSGGNELASTTILEDGVIYYAANRETDSQNQTTESSRIAVPICLTSSNSSGTPFNCDYNAYLFQADDIYAVDLAAGNAVLVAENFIGTNVNAAAYNPKDGYIWASVTSPSKTIIRIGKDYATDSYTINQLGTSNRYIGAINADGVYFAKGGGDTFYKIDLDPDSNSYTQFLASQNLSQSINIHDWAFNAVDNQLYTVEKGTNILYRINPQTAAVESLGEVPALSGLNYTYGAVYFDVEGRFYVSSNQSGTIYVIQNVQDLTGSNAITSNFFAFGPSSSLNDGARCPTAPVPQENCTNGIDDDSDGLIDCDDPVCSGVSSCPEMDEPTSGGDDGGVESNNRLSEVINRRNYHRLRTNHKFDFKKMPKRLKSKSYGRSKTTYSLSDFIPIATLGEDYSVESSPTDLIGITNATAIYAVDYIRKNKTIASILSLETDSGVYEHTKYICDRLLGAEILSIATIEINGQNFIRTILKNAEGNLEFTISFSVREREDTTAMVVESHWNLDKYHSDKGFYNFQIWTNSIDDLIHLSEEVLRLVTVQKPIDTYILSSPPPVYVKNGFYQKGALHLQVINTNSSNNILLEGGKRLTETSAVSNISQALSLNKYMNKVTIETGSLFDFGFRIGDGVQTPDDLFLSDGPWGYDDAALSTSVSSFSVSQNTSLFPGNVLGIERNVALNANTADYISLYRALTPRYQPYDLSNYNSIRFEASGSGNLKLRLIKKSIDTWENQFVTQVKLSEDIQTYTIPFADFNSSFHDDLQVEDIVTIVFTMTSETGKLIDKRVTLQQLQFQNTSSLGTSNLFLEKNRLILFPNPMVSESNLLFNIQNAKGKIQFKVFDQLGKLVQEYSHDGMEGENIIRLQKEQLTPGMYFGKLTKENGQILGFVKIVVH